MKILVIEDEQMLLKAISFRLKKDKHELTMAKNGQEAIELIKKHTPDLIITDILMPFIGGLEILNYVKNKLSIKIPVIILSGLGLEKTVLDAFKLGADDFITKPFSPEELSARVNRIFIKHEQN